MTRILYSSMILVLLFQLNASAQERRITLGDAYTSAFRSYESVRIAQEGVRSSEAVIDQAWAYIYPHLKGNAAYTWYNEVLPPPSPAASPGTSSFTFQPKDQVTAGLTLSQPIYTGGRTLAALRTAKALREVSLQEHSAARQDLMLSVASAFYGVLKAGRLVEASRDSLERMERNRRITEREAAVRRNKANESALLRANTLVSGARIVLVSSENVLRMAKRNLSLLTGLPESSPLVEPDLMDVPEEEYGALLETALRNRQDYLSAKLSQEIAFENVKIVRGAHYPQIYADGGIRYKSSDPQTLDEGTTYYGGVRLEVPLFEGGLMRAEVSEARARLRQAELGSDLRKRTIESEVYEAWANLQTTKTVIGMLKQQYDDAKSNFRTVEDLYREGLASGLQLIDAQQALLLAERSYIDVLYDQQVAILKLRRAVGLLDAEKTDRKAGDHATS